MAIMKERVERQLLSLPRETSWDFIERHTTQPKEQYINLSEEKYKEYASEFIKTALLAGLKSFFRKIGFRI